ncbi:Lipoyltransferase and lipoate-protein ligase [Roridomyces roridus]|uniref:Putative lipoate-protein ligase A n=1 Tax=Roridomyces roridus TaxID=1738132 RepID=A0AAD7C5K1_9AGAR|nr:Lipoyltransferase and lipoate-protein ligase [Roridomyces roridus]
MAHSILSRAATRRILTRNFSTRQGPAPEIQNSIYISRATSPLFNLSFEDWLFRHAPPDRPLLFLYRNTPCVVIGRNQNPWLEVNMGALQTRDVQFIRRRSGGGTVYHDLGNTNFSIHLARAAFDRHATARLILRAVQSMGIPNARLNDRNDICVGEDKVSGSAYKIVNARAYHHGTMLISTQLDTLGDLLRVDKSLKEVTSTGVSSVRSPVCNLQQFRADVNHDQFARAVEDVFREEYGIDKDRDPTQIIDESSGDQSYISSGITELETWPWKYGQTPAFECTASTTFPFGHVNVRIKSKHGLITDSVLHTEGVSEEMSQKLTAFVKEAEGQEYGRWPPLEDSDTSHAGAAQAVGEWLRKVLR